MTQLAKPGGHDHAPSALEGISLQQIATLLNQGKWLIAGFVTLMVAGGLVYTQLAPPVYQSKALIDVSQKTDTDRNDNSGNLLLNYHTSPVDTEMDIVTSRVIMAQAVQRLNLGIEVTPTYFPVLGEIVARYAAHGADLRPTFGSRRYVWGNEHLRVARFHVPPAFVGKALHLVVGENGQYALCAPDGKPLVTGQVGHLASALLPGTTGQRVEILVSEIKAHPGAEFSVTERPDEAVAAALQHRIKVAGKAAGSPGGIMELTFTGDEPQKVAQILNTVVQVYIRQNIERKQEETANILAFLNKQLPVVKASLDKAETALASYNSAHGGVDVPVEAQAVTGQLNDVERELLSTRIQLIELEQNFGDRHPAVITVKNKLQQLQARKAALSRQASTLPASSQTVARLTRDVKVNSDLYMRMLNKAQELNTAKAGIVGNLHLIENAVPAYSPVNTPPMVILLFNAVAGLMIGIVVVLGRRLLANQLENVPALEQKLGLPVYVSIPHSNKQHGLAVDALLKGEKALPILALREPHDWALEQLRRLRTKLLHVMAECKNNIVSITSPTQSNGKSFVSVNLAHLCAVAERRVLLIDADMRRAGASAYFSGGKKAGLADVLDGMVPLQTALQETELPHLDFLSAGTANASAADLLTGATFKQLLADASKLYDLVIVDTPPVLAATDAVILAPLAGLNLIVAHAGRSRVRLIEQAIKELGKHSEGRLGIVINDIRAENQEAIYAY